jgi:hypothetical protein
VRLSNNFYIGICLIGWLLGSAIPYLNVEKVDLISDALPFGQLWYDNFQPRAREYGRDRFPQLVRSSWFWWPSSLVRTQVATPNPAATATPARTATPVSNFCAGQHSVTVFSPEQVFGALQSGRS